MHTASPVKQDHSGLIVEQSPIDQFLASQQTLQTPVAIFAREHESLLVREQESYQSLIPLTLPEAGRQYAFEVDLDRCTGCKACVAGCHSLNGLEEDETWRDVGVIQGVNPQGAYIQTVTTACHHCADPACLNGCPVLAYDKDPVTGIVRHLDDQCIGCQYCVLKCPYEVPKYNEKLGIVRKCDMCQSRLAEGEAPACVQACPTEAIRITTVDIPDRETVPAFLPASPEPSYTLPTTQYVSKKTIPDNVAAGDLHFPRVEHAHYPLVFMLTLTQAGIGGLLAAAFSSLSQQAEVPTVTSAICLSFLMLGLGCSILHLGRPLGAWRAFLGLKKSWLSREIVAFGIFAPAAILFTAQQWFGVLPDNLNVSLTLLTALLGLTAGFTSVMIYVDTQRHNWRLTITMSEFGMTILNVGMGMLTLSLWLSSSAFDASGAVWLSIAALAFLLNIRRSALRSGTSPDAQRSQLLQGPLRQRNQIRLALGIISIGCLTIGLLWQPWFIIPAIITAILGEGIGRALYFQSVIAPKMPGSFRQ